MELEENGYVEVFVEICTRAPPAVQSCAGNLAMLKYFEYFDKGSASGINFFYNFTKYTNSTMRRDMEYWGKAGILEFQFWKLSIRREIPNSPTQ